MDPVTLPIAAIIAYFVGSQCWALYCARRVHGMELKPSDMPQCEKALIQGRGIIYFHSPSCVFCKPMTPFIREMAGERDDVLCVDASEDPELAKRLGIRGTPCIVVIVDGKVDRAVTGGQTRNRVLELLEEG
ncbi:MAG: thioredoxin family protein [Gammaproteobacteria bacterium]